MPHSESSGPPTEIERISPLNPSHTKRTIAIVLVLIVALSVVSAAYFLGVFSPHTSWLFKGAYATYSGETTVLTVPFNVTIGFHVVNFNSTHVEVLTYYSVQSKLGSRTNQSSQWEKLSSTFNSTIPGATLVRQYDTARLIGSNAIDCTAYEYSEQGATVTAYVSNSVGFPVELTFQFTSNGNLTFDLPIVHTNIPGLE